MGNNRIPSPIITVYQKQKMFTGLLMNYFMIWEQQYVQIQ